MLKFYYSHRSPVARSVWLTLLEKNIEFEPVLFSLNGDQFQPDFLAINPFHHVPVVVDDGFRVVESLAILDYLESKYPKPALLPTETKALATVRMVQMVTAHELLSKVVSLVYESEDSPQFLQAKQHVDKVLEFLRELLGDSPYFGSEQLTLADIFAGAGMPLLTKLGISLCNYPQLDDWFRRLMEREAWRKTEVSVEEFEKFKRVLVKLRKRKLSQVNHASK